MKIPELKQKIDGYKAAQLKRLVVEMYKAMPKSLKEGKRIDELAHVNPARTSSTRNRAPWLSDGLSQSIRVKTRSASSRRPRRQRHSPYPCRQRRNGRLSMYPQGSKPSNPLPNDSSPMCRPLDFLVVSALCEGICETFQRSGAYR